MRIKEPRDFLSALFQAAVAAADPMVALKAYMSEKPQGKTIVIGAGKGAAFMAAAFEKLWTEAGNGLLEGCVVTRYGYDVACKNIEVICANHPLPDKNSLLAAAKLQKAVSNLTSQDLVVALISGGGSALLAAPPHGLSLADEIALNDTLLRSGVPISVMNALRKHMSQIKGGRLAALAHPAKVVSLVVSDIPGDNPALVASGPTIVDAVTRHDALRYIDTYQLELPDRILAYLKTPEADAPSPSTPGFERDEVYVIASSGISLEAAALKAQKFGVQAVILSDAVEGEARDIALMHAALAREIILRNRPFKKPVVLLSGGETTVTMRGSCGRGGRNSEFMLALALALDGFEKITALAADTDGIDGSEDNAGAFFDHKTLACMRAQKLDPRQLLQNHDSWSGFHAAGDLFNTGPTGTNVNDFRAIFIE